MGIDGSTNTVGVCYGCYYQGILTVLSHHLIDVTRDEAGFAIIEEKFGSLLQRITRIENHLAEYCQGKHIDAVFYENHFINPRRPTSVIPLARSQHMIENFFMQHGIGVYTIAPQQMKKLIGTKVKGADKEDVREAVYKLVASGRFALAEGLTLADCSEHEIDAIGILYAKLVEDGLLSN